MQKSVKSVETFANKSAVVLTVCLACNLTTCDVHNLIKKYNSGKLRSFVA